MEATKIPSPARLRELAAATSPLGTPQELFDSAPAHADALADALEITDRLVHLDKRLRLRNPSTAMEQQVWAELREAARALLSRVTEDSGDN